MHGVNKIDISKHWYKNMEDFYIQKPDDFMEYALRDALITVIHAMYMEDFSFSLGGIGIPTTLSSLTAKNVLAQ